jgi:hypothetical protein
MEFPDALKFINQLLSQKNNQVLTDLEREIFIGCWSGQTYTQIATQVNHSEQYIRETATKLFNKIESVLGIKPRRFIPRQPKYITAIHVFVKQKTSALGLLKPLETSSARVYNTPT